MKDARVEELKKPQKPKVSAPQHSENAEISEKARKEKKNNCRHRRGYRAPKDGKPQEGYTPATGVNNSSTSGVENSQRNQNRGGGQDPG